MDFKLLVEETLNEHGDIYTVDEITNGNYSIWEVSARRMKEVQRFLRKEGFYKLGIRGLVVDIEPRNEIEQKAKEILASNPGIGYYEIQSELYRWVTAGNIPKERATEITKEYKKKGMRAPELVAVRILSYGIIILPHKKIEATSDIQKQAEYRKREELMDKLTVGLRELRISPHFTWANKFEEDMQEIGITQFKVYSEYNLDKETEQQWGEIANEL